MTRQDISDSIEPSKADSTNTERSGSCSEKEMGEAEKRREIINRS